MTDKQIIIDGKECRYWFRPNPDDYRKCSLRGKNDNCDEIINQYKQALDEIRQYRVAEINDEDEEKTDTILRIVDGV